MAIHNRKYLLAFMVAAVAQSCPNNLLLATTKALVSFTCPICNNRFEGHTIASTNSFGGRDRDFLSRAAGEQPIPLFPKTCPKCLYSGYESDFPPKGEIAEAVKQQILDKRVLKSMLPITEGGKPYEIPAYVRYDLIAQTYQLRGQTEEAIAWQFLRASWAIRLESDVPKTILTEELAKKVSDWQASQWDREEAVKYNDRVRHMILKGKEYEQAARASEGEARTLAAIAALRTLRSYGENLEAQRLLPLLKTVMSAEQYTKCEQFINDSITREQGFQSKAVILFEGVLPTKEGGQEKAPLMYLCGELHRRLGNWEKARSYYEQCVAIEGHPKWLDEWAKEQKDLLPK